MKLVDSKTWLMGQDNALEFVRKLGDATATVRAVYDEESDNWKLSSWWNRTHLENRTVGLGLHAEALDMLDLALETEDADSFNSRMDREAAERVDALETGRDEHYASGEG